MNEVLSVSHLTVRFAFNTAVNDFSVGLRAGNVVALLGGNGSGKTTILRTILGFIRPTSGNISIFGSPATPRTYKEMRKRIGYVPQSPTIDFRMPMTVEDVVSIGRYGRVGIGRKLSAYDKAIIQQSMQEAGVSHLAQRPIGHLSGGEHRKVQIARALCQQPDLLLLDEPTSNLDLGAQYELLDLLEEVFEQKKITSLIVMHDLQSLPKRCNRAVILSGGQKVFEGNLEGIFTRETLSHIYAHNTERVLCDLVARGRR